MTGDNDPNSPRIQALVEEDIARMDAANAAVEKSLTEQAASLLAQGLAQPVRVDFRELYFAQADDVARLKTALRELIEYVESGWTDQDDDDVHPDARPHVVAQRAIDEVEERHTKRLGLLPK